MDHQTSHHQILKNYLHSKSKPLYFFTSPEITYGITKLYNEIIIRWTPENDKETLKQLKRLWNEDCDFLPLLASSKKFPICTFATIILAEFAQKKANNDGSCLWNFFLKVSTHFIFKDKEFQPLYKLFHMLAFEGYSEDVWLNTLWPTKYKTIENDYQNEIIYKDCDTCCDSTTGKCFLRHANN